MAECLTENPNLAQCPDYTLLRFKAVCNVFFQVGKTVEKAIHVLKATWTAENRLLRELRANQQQLNGQEHPPPYQPTPEQGFEPPPRE
jgi:hypothetical protein